MKYFENVKDLEDLKKQYKKLAFLHHPDVGGSTESMQKVNGEYEKLFTYYKNIHNEDPKNAKKQKNETSTMYTDFINKIINLKGLEIEIIGVWVWIGGDTKEHKEILKSNGCKWTKNKKLWYFRTEEYKSKNRKKFTINEIRDRYGSVKPAPNKPLLT